MLRKRSKKVRWDVRGKFFGKNAKVRIENEIRDVPKIKSSFFTEKSFEESIRGGFFNKKKTGASPRVSENILYLLIGTKKRGYVLGRVLKTRITDKELEYIKNKYPAYVFLPKAELKEFWAPKTESKVVPATRKEKRALFRRKKHIKEEYPEKISKKALDIAKSRCTEATVIGLYSNFGDLALRRGNYAEAEHWYEEARKGLEKVGSRSRLSSRLIDLGIAKLKQEKLDAARDFYEKGLALSQERHRPDNIVNAKLGLAIVDEKQGNRTDAIKLARESLEMAERLGIRRESEEARALLARLEGKRPADR